MNSALFSHSEHRYAESSYGTQCFALFSPTLFPTQHSIPHSALSTLHSALSSHSALSTLHSALYSPLSTHFPIS
uniref:Uncharacterized protein n=1 Tax=Desertifilum tharense IPPAS B-1220 TaxID=1781255 RepID=A0ACD5GWU9_9CYAN